MHSPEAEKFFTKTVWEFKMEGFYLELTHTLLGDNPKREWVLNCVDLGIHLQKLEPYEDSVDGAKRAAKFVVMEALYEQIGKYQEILRKLRDEP